VFTDISLTGKSAVLVVYISDKTHSHQLLMLDAAKAWELVFTDSEDVNRWAEERYRWVKSALTAAIGKPARQALLAEVS
jgi:ribosomal protein L18